MFTLKAAQMDLARQMEPVEHIEEFIDFIADYGYNALVLYLEAKVKTASVSFMPDSECYTPEEMKRVVEYAASKNIETIPVVSNLGHAELFLKYPEMKHLSEIREGVDGRFNNFDDAFCPSLEELYDFTEKYFAEVAEIFPSEYFHAGCDEVWNMGLCSLCKKRVENGETIFDIYFEHLMRTYKIVTEKLGKKMMIWDDMFDDATDMLEKTPKDIIMCNWAYNLDMEKSSTHFGQRRYSYRLAEYDRLGFKYLVCPAPFDYRNVESFTRYGKRFNPFGWLMTSWEKSKLYIYENLVSTAFGGKLWNSDNTASSSEVLDETVKEFFNIDDPVFVSAIRSFLCFNRTSDRPEIPANLRGNLTPYEIEKSEKIQLLYNLLPSFADKISGPLQQKVFTDIMAGIKREMLRLGCRKFFNAAYKLFSGEEAFDRKKLLRDAKGLIALADDIKNIRIGQFEQNRKMDRTIDKASPGFDQYISSINEVVKHLNDEGFKAGILKMHYFLPDYFSAQRVELFVKYKGEDEWDKVYSSQPKPDCLDFNTLTYYEIDSILAGGKIPEKLRIETNLYGGIGIVYSQVWSDGKRYIPAEANAVDGIVESPDSALVFDTSACEMGEKDTHALIHNPERAKKLHIMEIAYKEDKDFS
jgi:hypothetical protein